MSAAAPRGAPAPHAKGTDQRSALEAWPEILTTHLAGRRPLLFLDYDGTLSPIVKDPDK